MKSIRIIMNMPVILEIADAGANDSICEEIFSYFRSIEARFSLFKLDSEISAINRKEIEDRDYSEEMKEIFALAEETKKETRGYFDIRKPDGSYDTSGLVKGWAISNAAQILRRHGFKNFYVSVGGDIQVSGKNSAGEAWIIGIQNPFNKQQEIVKVLNLSDRGIATSGTYVRGRHIYNPKDIDDKLDEIVSLTVVGPDVYEADRFATAAFTMGRDGINFLESLEGFEGYMIDKRGIATLTSGFHEYTN
jgi:thiamine biosynthesis lipoprotein